jgi:vancomycin resistance protein VanJ
VTSDLIIFRSWLTSSGGPLPARIDAVVPYRIDGALLAWTSALKYSFESQQAYNADVKQDPRISTLLFQDRISAGDLPEPTTATAKKKASWKRVFATGFSLLVWIYLLLLLAFWLMIYFAGDRWWLATVVLFGPRWIGGLPLAAFVPLAAVWRRRMLWPLAAAVLLVVGPIMGFCLPWARLAGSSSTTIRILTCNLKGHCRDNAALDALISESDADIVAFQGWKPDARVHWPDGWHVCGQGELVVASRYPVSEVSLWSGPQGDGVSRRPDVFYCRVSLPQRDIAFCSAHFPSPHYGLAETLDRRTLISDRGRQLIGQETAERRTHAQTAVDLAREIELPLVLAGDFNTTADSTIYRQTWSHFNNAFTRGGLGFGYTERPGIHGWQFGLRIDHILSSSHWRPYRAWVGPDVGSDHLPLLADLAWKSSSGDN